MAEFEAPVTTPETSGQTEGNVNEEGQQEGNERSATPADIESSDTDESNSSTEKKSKPVTKQEGKELEFVKYLKENGQLPKGVEAFRDEDGSIKFKVPMDGKKHNVSFKQLISGYNLEQVGSAKLNEAKYLEKQLERVISDIKADNPDGKKHLAKLLNKLGYDKGKLADEWLAEYIADAQKTDEERAREKRLADIEERERALKEREDKIEAEKSKGAIKSKQQQFTDETIKAMKEAKLDNVKPELKKRLMVKTFAKMYEDRLANQNVERPTLMTAKEALEDVLNEYQMVISDALSMYGMEAVKKRIPKEFIDAVMKESLSTKGNEPKNLNSFEQNREVEADVNKTKANKQKDGGKKLLSEWLLS